MSKAAIITGSSRGIGAATAIRLAQDGFNICVNYRRDKSAAMNVVKQIESLGQKAIAVQADVSNEHQVKELFEKSDRQLGQLLALVNNAGILHQQSRLVDMNAERINEVLSTNVTSTFLCSKHAIIRMSRKNGGQGGAIVNVSSAAARLGAANEYIDYAASKGAIDTLTIGLANEVADEAIRVNAVRPGFIYTDMHASAGEANRVDRLKDSLPIKRGGEASEVASAISWLVSDESSYTTGAFIEVSGGR